MIFAIDLDSTWTGDPGLFNAFVRLLRERGHVAIMVTGRVKGDNQDFPRYEIPSDLKVFATGGEPKRAYLSRVHDINPDIWIDDSPEMIVGSGDVLLDDMDNLEGFA